MVVERLTRLLRAAAGKPAAGAAGRTPRELLPDAVVVRPRMMGVGDGVCATLVVTGYPAEVGPGWLEPLLIYPGHVDVSLHIEPIPTTVATQRLRRQRARLESSRRQDYSKGHLDDPETEAAAQDAADLAYRVARAEAKLFLVGLYITVHAADEETLAEELAAVRAVAESLLLRTAPATFRALQGWITTLPLGVDVLDVTRTMDTSALAASFPFTSPDLPSADPAELAAPTGGVLYGMNAAGAGLVMWDRWAQDNHNSIVLARSGAGKSYFTKLELIRSLYDGVQAAVIDPEGEYVRLARAVGGTVVAPGEEGVRINPFDLPQRAAHGRTRRDALTGRILFLHTLLSILLGGELGAAQKAVLDQALLATYQGAGITTDSRTWKRPAPVLEDLQRALQDVGDGVAGELAARLAPFTIGSHSGLFAGATTTPAEGHLVVFDLRQLPEELKAVGMLLTLDAIWSRVTDPGDRRRRLVVVDEAWLLMQEGAGAHFLFRAAKSARKHWAGLAVVTQDAEDVLSTDLGRAVVNNAATQVLLRQAPQAADVVGDAFLLSDGECEFLQTASRGEGLLIAGSHRVAFASLASEAEHVLVTTDPAEIAAFEQRGPVPVHTPWTDADPWDDGDDFEDDQFEDAELLASETAGALNDGDAE